MCQIYVECYQILPFLHQSQKLNLKVAPEWLGGLCLWAYNNKVTGSSSSFSRGHCTLAHPAPLEENHVQEPRFSNGNQVSGSLPRAGGALKHQANLHARTTELDGGATQAQIRFGGSLRMRL